MKDLEKYINRTREKTKKEKLPIKSIMPDGAAGISSFNDYAGENGGQIMGEEFNEGYKQELESNIIQTTLDYMRAVGFEEDAEAYTDFDFEETDSGMRVEVRAELDYDAMYDLADILTQVIMLYDKNAYFDMVTSGTIEAYVRENIDINEHLKRLDKKGFNVLHENYDLQQLYESRQDRLDNNDKSKLQKFLKITDDPEEINTYLNSLLKEDTGIWTDPEPPSEKNIEYFEQVSRSLQQLQTAVELLQEQARETNNVDLDDACGNMLITLDDLSKYDLYEIQDIIETI